MRSEAVRKVETEVSAQVLPAVETDQGHGPLALLTLGAVVLLCYFLFPVNLKP